MITMLKVVAVFILVGVFSSSLVNAAAKEECEGKGGKYCPGPKIKMCYLILKEEVSSFQEATDLCAKNGAELYYVDMTDYSNFLNCTKFPWDFPFTMFAKNPLPTEDKCLTCTLISVAELSIQSRCSIEGKAKVICEIKL
ncbi:hypothetical protein Anas_05415 [Armadillidium nasatum]|uniref:C-type lectin domain-containing protein n=1 Tax=Armadillidium nasatum TaxID=96803 RepID=A0A5N5TN91_9CRUS|nr:hypothetical protein Anas_05415 [Armadillidium nasatum]